MAYGNRLLGYVAMSYEDLVAVYRETYWALQNPSPNTGNNWHSNGTTATDSLSAEQARNVSVGREGRSASCNVRRPVVHLLPHINLDDLYIEHPSDFPLRFDALYREYLKSMASPETCTLVDIMKNHIRFKQEMTKLLGCVTLFMDQVRQAMGWNWPKTT